MRLGPVGGGFRDLGGLGRATECDLHASDGAGCKPISARCRIFGFVLHSSRKVTAKAPLPVIQEFKTLIENDPNSFMLCLRRCLIKSRVTAPYLNDPVGNPQIRDYREMLAVMNQVLTQAPEFNQTDLVGFPINAIVRPGHGNTGRRFGFPQREG